jgi:hypothetical protein
MMAADQANGRVRAIDSLALSSGRAIQPNVDIQIVKQKLIAVHDGCALIVEHSR